MTATPNPQIRRSKTQGSTTTVESVLAAPLMANV